MGEEATQLFGSSIVSNTSRITQSSALSADIEHSGSIEMSTLFSNTTPTFNCSQLVITEALLRELESSTDDSKLKALFPISCQDSLLLTKVSRSSLQSPHKSPGTTFSPTSNIGTSKGDDQNKKVPCKSPKINDESHTHISPADSFCKKPLKSNPFKRKLKQKKISVNVTINSETDSCNETVKDCSVSVRHKKNPFLSRPKRKITIKCDDLDETSLLEVSKINPFFVRPKRKLTVNCDDDGDENSSLGISSTPPSFNVHDLPAFPAEETQMYNDKDIDVPQSNEKNETEPHGKSNTTLSLVSVQNQSIENAVEAHTDQVENVSQGQITVTTKDISPSITNMRATVASYNLHEISIKGNDSLEKCQVENNYLSKEVCQNSNELISVSKKQFSQISDTDDCSNKDNQNLSCNAHDLPASVEATVEDVQLCKNNDANLQQSNEKNEIELPGKCNTTQSLVNLQHQSIGNANEINTDEEENVPQGQISPRTKGNSSNIPNNTRAAIANQNLNKLDEISCNASLEECSPTCHIEKNNLSNEVWQHNSEQISNPIKQCAHIPKHDGSLNKDTQNLSLNVSDLPNEETQTYKDKDANVHLSNEKIETEPSGKYNATISFVELQHQSIQNTIEALIDKVENDESQGEIPLRTKDISFGILNNARETVATQNLNSLDDISVKRNDPLAEFSSTFQLEKSNLDKILCQSNTEQISNPIKQFSPIPNHDSSLNKVTQNLSLEVYDLPDEEAQRYKDKEANLQQSNEKNEIELPGKCNATQSLVNVQHQSIGNASEINTDKEENVPQGQISPRTKGNSSNIPNNTRATIANPNLNSLHEISVKQNDPLEEFSSTFQVEKNNLSKEVCQNNTEQISHSPKQVSQIFNSDDSLNKDTQNLTYNVDLPACTAEDIQSCRDKEANLLSNEKHETESPGKCNTTISLVEVQHQSMQNTIEVHSDKDENESQDEIPVSTKDISSGVPDNARETVATQNLNSLHEISVNQNDPLEEFSSISQIEKNNLSKEVCQNNIEQISHSPKQVSQIFNSDDSINKDTQNLTFNFNDLPSSTVQDIQSYNDKEANVLLSNEKNETESPAKCNTSLPFVEVQHQSALNTIEAHIDKVEIEPQGEILVTAKDVASSTLNNARETVANQSLNNLNEISINCNDSLEECVLKSRGVCQHNTKQISDSKKQFSQIINIGGDSLNKEIENLSVIVNDLPACTVGDKQYSKDEDANILHSNSKIETESPGNSLSLVNGQQQSIVNAIEVHREVGCVSQGQTPLGYKDESCGIKDDLCGEIRLAKTGATETTSVGNHNLSNLHEISVKGNAPFEEYSPFVNTIKILEVQESVHVGKEKIQPTTTNLRRSKRSRNSMGSQQEQQNNSAVDQTNTDQQHKKMKTSLQPEPLNFHDTTSKIDEMILKEEATQTTPHLTRLTRSKKSFECQVEKNNLIKEMSQNNRDQISEVKKQFFQLSNSVDSLNKETKNISLNVYDLSACTAKDIQSCRDKDANVVLGHEKNETKPPDKCNTALSLVNLQPQNSVNSVGVIDKDENVFQGQIPVRTKDKSCSISNNDRETVVIQNCSPSANTMSSVQADKEKTQATTTVNLLSKRSSNSLDGQQGQKNNSGISQTNTNEVNRLVNISFQPDTHNFNNITSNISEVSPAKEGVTETNPHLRRRSTRSRKSFECQVKKNNLSKEVCQDRNELISDSKKQFSQISNIDDCLNKDNQNHSFNPHDLPASTTEEIRLHKDNDANLLQSNEKNDLPGKEPTQSLVNVQHQSIGNAIEINTDKEENVLQGQISPRTKDNSSDIPNNTKANQNLNNLHEIPVKGNDSLHECSPSVNVIKIMHLQDTVNVGKEKIQPTTTNLRRSKRSRNSMASQQEQKNNSVVDQTNTDQQHKKVKISLQPEPLNFRSSKIGEMILKEGTTQTTPHLTRRSTRSKKSLEFHVEKSNLSKEDCQNNIEQSLDFKKPKRSKKSSETLVNKTIKDLSYDSSLDLSCIPHDKILPKKGVIFHSTPFHRVPKRKSNLQINELTSVKNAEDKITHSLDVQESYVEQPRSLRSAKSLNVTGVNVTTSLQSPEFNKEPTLSQSRITLKPQSTVEDTESDDSITSNKVVADTSTPIRPRKRKCKSYFNKRKKSCNADSVFGEENEESIEKEKPDNIFKMPKLFKPARWVNNNLYNFLESKLTSVNKLERRRLCEEFVIDLYHIFLLVTKGNGDYNSALCKLKLRLKELHICITNLDYCMFVYNFLPFDFQKKILPLGGAFDCKSPINMTPMKPYIEL